MTRSMNTSLGRRRLAAPFLALAALASLGMGPCGPIPGGSLSGERVEARVADWSFVNRVPRCALEVRPSRPRSMTVNCMSHAERLFVSCSACASKQWSAMALAEPSGRVAIEGRVYPVSLARVTDPTLLESVWLARSTKLGNDSAPRPEDWWTFELVSR